MSFFMMKHVVTMSLMLGALLSAPVFAQTVEVTSDTGVTVATEVVTEPVQVEGTAVTDETVVVSADTSTVNEDTVAPAETASANTQVNQKPPNRFGLFLFGLRERLSLLTTIDPVKKAEKEAVFAEQRIAIAEKILASSANDSVKARAAALIDRAQTLLGNAEKREDALKSAPGVRAAAALRNIADSQVRLGVVLDRIEAKLPESAKESFEARRAMIEEKSQGIMRAIQNPNMPEAVKEHLKTVEERVKAQAEATKEFRDERRDLLEKVQNGDEAAKAELQDLQHERKATLEGLREEYKDAKESLKEAAKNGNTTANRTLQMIDRAQGKMMEKKMEDRVEDRMEKRMEKPPEGRPAESVNARPEERKESNILPVRALQRARELERKVDARNAAAQVELDGNARIVQ